MNNFSEAMIVQYAANKTLIQGAISAAGLVDVPRRAVDSIFSNLDTAIRAETPASAAIKKMYDSPQYAASYRIEQISAALIAARAVADTALKAAAAGVDTAKAAITASVFSGRSSAMTDVLVLDRKADLIRLLDGTNQVLNTACTLLSDALTTSDGLTRYVLAAGPLTLYYKARGVDALTLELSFLQLFAEQGSSTARFRLDRFSGSDGFPACVDLCAQIVYQQFAELVQAANFSGEFSMGVGTHA